MSGFRQLPQMPKMGKSAPRPPRIRTGGIRAYGPRNLRLQSAPRQVAGGPGAPPVGFNTAHNSDVEWIVYWALAKHYGDPREPRRPPFTGGREWDYQVDDSGGRVAAGSVTDFVCHMGLATYALRVETERYHIFTSAEKIMSDLFIKTHVVAVDRVISLYDQHFIGDTTGRSALRVVGLALKGIELPNPIRFGTATRIRPPDNVFSLEGVG